MYKKELKDNKEFFDKDIVKYLIEHKDNLTEYIKWNKYVRMYNYSRMADMLYSEVLNAFLLRCKDYSENYEGSNIDTLGGYVRYLIKIELRSYILKEVARDNLLVSLDADYEHGGKDYLNCKEFALELYNKYVDSSMDMDMLSAMVRDLYIRGLRDKEDYMLIVYMLYRSDLSALIDYYVMHGRDIGMGVIKDIIEKNEEITSILIGLESVESSHILGKIRDRVNDIEVVDRYLGIRLGRSN